MGSTAKKGQSQIQNFFLRDGAGLSYGVFTCFGVLLGIMHLLRPEKLDPLHIYLCGMMTDLQIK